jgi:hyperosmotically inducible protein
MKKERNMRKKIAMFVIATFVFIGLKGMPVEAVDMDDQIEKSIKDTYAYKKYLKNDDISVDAENGVVTLTGSVETQSHKQLAQETAAKVPDVTKVDNQLKVEEPEESEMSDGWISAKVKAALLFHRSVSAVDTEVFVQDGIVTLKGVAENIAQKDLTSQYAKDVDGVKNVNNQMTISQEPKEKEEFADKVDDASITAQVKLALLSHRSTSALRTDVETKDGEVTLTGEAKNQAEKDLVTKLVSDIDGVQDVENDMTVKE